jgi:hypothetical protein
MRTSHAFHEQENGCHDMLKENESRNVIGSEIMLDDA